MNKLLVAAILFVLFLTCAPSPTVHANNTVRFKRASIETLVISGKGELEERDFNDRYVGRATTLVIGEGITKISYLPMPCVKKLVLPDSLLEIGGETRGGEYLEEIIFGKNLRIIGSRVFEDSNKLREVVVPDTVTEIGEYAFYHCLRLQKIVLPPALNEWNANAVLACPSLREVVNNSRISCEIPWYPNRVTWRVGKTKTRTIPPGQTGRSIGKKIPITFDLMGGEATGKLPKYYRFGQKLTLPNCVKRKGYLFAGWNTTMYKQIKAVQIGQRKAKKYYAMWCELKVTSEKRGEATVTFDSEGIVPYYKYWIRCANNKKMRNADYTFCNKKKGKVTIKNLEPGKTYYFQITGCDDEHGGEEDGEPDWWGKQKVSIRK